MSLVCLEMKEAPCGLREVGRGWILQELVRGEGGRGGGGVANLTLNAMEAAFRSF